MGESSATRHGNGSGWGGPAKGAGNGNPRSQDAGRDAWTMGMPGDAEAKEAKRVERVERMKGILVEIAEDDGQPASARVNAAVAYLNREEGMPVQQNVNRQDGGIEVIVQKLARDDAE